MQTLAACNQIGSPLREAVHDAKFVRLMVIALYTREEIAAKQFPSRTRDLMERLFAFRVADREDRMAQLNNLFSTALKEAIVRNGKNAEKLSKIQLPANIFDRKKK